MADSIPQSQLLPLQSVFQKLSDKDQTIGPKQLGFILRAMKLTPTDSELLDIISEVDSSGLGRMNLPEFVNFMTRPLKLEMGSNEEIGDAFDCISRRVKSTGGGNNGTLGFEDSGKSDNTSNGNDVTFDSTGDSSSMYVTQKDLHVALNETFLPPVEELLSNADGTSSTSSFVTTPISISEIKEMISEADVDDNNGRISKEDFVFAMESKHKGVK